MSETSEAVKFVFDALANPEATIERGGIGSLHTALKPHLLNWSRDRGTLERPIVMVSAVGSVNYGTVVESSDVDMKAVYMPAFEDLYHNRFPKFSFTTDEFDCELHPAHHFCHHVLKGNINFFEFLYAEHGACLARPDFIYIMKNILQPLVEMNVTMTCMASYFTALQQNKGIGYMVEGNWSNKKASHAIRTLAFLINLLDTGTLDIKVKEPILCAVLRLKRGEMDWNEYAQLFTELESVAKGMLFKRWVNGGDFEHTDRVLELDGTNTAKWHELRAELDNELMRYIREPIRHQARRDVGYPR